MNLFKKIICGIMVFALMTFLIPGITGGATAIADSRIQSKTITVPTETQTFYIFFDDNYCGWFNNELYSPTNVPDRMEVNVVIKSSKGVVAKSVIVTLPTNIPTVPYAKFLGWAKTPDATKAAYKPGQRILFDATKGDMTLYAVWKQETTPDVLMSAFVVIEPNCNLYTDKEVIQNNWIEFINGKTEEDIDLLPPTMEMLCSWYGDGFSDWVNSLKAQGKTLCFKGWYVRTQASEWPSTWYPVDGCAVTIYPGDYIVLSGSWEIVDGFVTPSPFVYPY